MELEWMRWWKAGLLLVRGLVVGLLGGVGMMFLLLYAVYLYAEYAPVAAPRGLEERRDPMAGAVAFYYLAPLGFLVGAGLALAADFAVRRWRNR